MRWPKVRYGWLLPGRKNDGCGIKMAPIKALTAAVTVVLVFSFEGYPASWADRETGKSV